MELGYPQHLITAMPSIPILVPAITQVCSIISFTFDVALTFSHRARGFTLATGDGILASMLYNSVHVMSTKAVELSNDAVLVAERNAAQLGLQVWVVTAVLVGLSWQSLLLSVVIVFSFSSMSHPPLFLCFSFLCSILVVLMFLMFIPLKHLASAFNRASAAFLAVPQETAKKIHFNVRENFLLYAAHTDRDRLVRFTPRFF